MRLKGILITLVVVFGAAFAAVNWQALFTVQPVDLFFTTVEVPLGLLLLLLAISLSLVFFLVSLFERAVQLRQLTRQEKTIRSLRRQLERRRLEEMVELGETVRRDLEQVARELKEENSRLEISMREDVSSFETRMRDRMDEFEHQLGRPAIDPLPPEAEPDHER
ncbi:MAG TPA: hypothetical protein VK092_07115 [Deinococcales bacterium]|nr:hypothetical protein [Deinococcales bacterium]